MHTIRLTITLAVLILLAPAVALAQTDDPGAIVTAIASAS
jgi:hypothetical protein